jgi:ASC-1-like (ASCH) protein
MSFRESAQVLAPKTQVIRRGAPLSEGRGAIRDAKRRSVANGARVGMAVPSLVHEQTTIKRLDGIETVVNEIEVLPSSRRDDAIRMRVYRAIYENRPLEQYGTRALPPIHIIVKNGAVTLEGVVDSEADRSAAHLKALKAAHYVTDNLRVAPEG